MTGSLSEMIVEESLLDVDVSRQDFWVKSVEREVSGSGMPSGSRVKEQREVIRSLR